jgi:hypothetical protein
MRKFSGILLGMVVFLLAGACSDDPGGPPVTIFFEPPQDGVGDLQVYTNDPAEYGHGFYHWFAAEDPPVYKIRANKISGNSDYGYGMIFCVVTEGGYATAYYRLLITTDQAYQVVKETNIGQDSFTRKFLMPESSGDSWPETGRLISGYNKNNVMEIRKTNATTFAIYFNDYLVNSFTDTEPLSGTRVGYYAGIGTAKDENFPDVPVDIRFSRP